LLRNKKPISWKRGEKDRDLENHTLSRNINQSHYISTLLSFQAFVVFATVLAAAAAAPQVTINKVGYGPSSFVRAPAHDSASIEHHRLGGNFAYSPAEAHAFAEVTPEISVATHPVAETTYTHLPAAIKTVQPAPIVNTHHEAKAIIGHRPILAQEPVIGPVATRTISHTPIYKQQHVTVSQPHATLVSQPHVAVAAAPAAVAVEAPAVAVKAAPAIATAPAIAAAPALGYSNLAYGAYGVPALAAAHPAGIY